MSDSHRLLVGLLDAAGARYRVVEHAAEGRSEEISVIRGNHPSQALKAMTSQALISLHQKHPRQQLYDDFKKT